MACEPSAEWPALRERRRRWSELLRRMFKERYLDQALAAEASGKAVATAETKSLGCTIRFRKKA